MISGRAMYIQDTTTHKVKVKVKWEGARRQVVRPYVCSTKEQ